VSFALPFMIETLPHLSVSALAATANNAVRAQAMDADRIVLMALIVISSREAKSFR
jgi:hypothetical protein